MHGGVKSMTKNFIFCTGWNRVACRNYFALVRELYKPPNSATFTLTQAALDAVLPKFVPGKRIG